MVKPEDRILTVGRGFMIDGKVVDTHYYSRYLEKHTELWFFTTGLGDQTLAQQMGDCFLEYCDTIGDPEMGRIMFSMGIGESAFYPYRGDYNVCWPWGVSVEDLEAHLTRIQVKQDLVIGPWSNMRERAEALGYATQPISVGVAPRFFKPLFLEREGLGYAGLDNKTDDQKHIVLGPALKRNDFEWHAKGIKDEWLTIPRLNEWYNRKKIVFGMIQEQRHRSQFVPSRFMETLATATPLIIYDIPLTEQYLGHKYPYMTKSYEETEDLMELILNDYEVSMTYMMNLSHHVRTEHSYTKKLGALFERLRELK